MSHQQKLKERAIERLIQDLAGIDPNDLEYCAYVITQLIENRPLVHRGLSAKGRPVGYTVDLFDLPHEVIAECSAEEKYFDDDFEKFKRTSNTLATRTLTAADSISTPRLSARTRNRLL